MLRGRRAKRIAFRAARGRTRQRHLGGGPPNPGSSAAAVSFGLYRRAFHITVRTEDATVAPLWLQHPSAAAAVIIVLARVGWHDLAALVAAARASDRRFLKHAPAPRIRNVAGVFGSIDFPVYHRQDSGKRLISASHDIGLGGCIGSAGSGMNSLSSATGNFMRPAFQSAAAWAMRSCDDETKFQ